MRAPSSCLSVGFGPPTSRPSPRATDDRIWSASSRSPSISLLFSMLSIRVLSTASSLALRPSACIWPARRPCRCLAAESGVASSRSFQRVESPARAPSLHGRAPLLRHGRDAQTRNVAMPTLGPNVAGAPVIERHNDAFDPETAEGRLSPWIPLAA